MKSIFLWFFLNNILFSLPLYIYDPLFSCASFIFITFFTLLWLSIYLIRKQLITKKSSGSNIALISFAVNIGYKFLMSLFFLGFVIYVYQILEMKFSILLFIFFYLVYTILIAKFGKGEIF